MACVSIRSEFSEAGKAALRALQSRAEFAPVPSWCVQGAYYETRTQICGKYDATLTVTNVQTGQITGLMYFLITDNNFLTANINRWSQDVAIAPYSITGSAAGTTIQGNASCSGACFVSSLTFPAQPMTTTTTATATATASMIYQTTATAAGTYGTGTGITSFNFTNPTWAGPSNSSSVSPPEPTRCDNATPGATSVGCVIPDYTPAWDVFITGAASFIQHMQSAHSSGMRGFYPSGPPLTRLTDTTLSRRNGDTACPASFPRPTGYSCDEYPFRSTHQGAYTGGGTGRTFSWCQIPALPTGVTGLSGWSACMIPATENSSAGGFLQAFYVQNRVIEADSFYTWD